MRHRIRSFLLVAWGLAGMAPAALAAGQWSAATLSEEAATRATAVSPPVIFAPASAAAVTDMPVSIAADATDPDATEILTISASGAPASLTLAHVPSVSPAHATLSGTAGAGDVGSYGIVWEVSDGSLAASTITDLTVTENQPPVVTAPPTVLATEAADFAFAVTAGDPDGEAIGSLTADPLPAGAVFTPNGFNSAGEFAWTPSVGQAGTYVVTFTAESGAPVRGASAATTITVLPQNNPPVVVAPGSVSARTSLLVTFNVTASDPDGDPIVSLTANGTQGTPLPAGATFAVNGDNTIGVFSWTPTSVQNVGLDFKATSGPIPVTTTAVTRINVQANRPPVVAAPTTVNGAEGSAIQLTVTASDPDGEAISSLVASGLPFGATFTTSAGNTSGTLDWSPDFSSAGTYPVAFTASNAQSGSATTQIVVSDQNRAPVADAGGPYAGFAGVPVAFDGSASSDPDGDPLTFAWDFGDGASGTGSTPSHEYGANGDYPVTLTVSDSAVPPLSGSATTAVTIAASFDAQVFTKNAYKTIRLDSGKPRWCAQFEPEATIPVTDIDPTSLELEYEGSMISAGGSKTTVATDTDGDGLQEITLCFAKEDLRTLFAGLPAGESTVTATIAGDLVTGGRISGDVEVDVFASGGALAASINPNPLNPEAVLSFKTVKPGAMRVRLYDLSGRFVRTVAEESNAAPGYHDVRIDGQTASGARMASGIYFFRIESADGVSVGRFTVLK